MVAGVGRAPRRLPKGVRKATAARKSTSTDEAVSYTHLDVYKRQAYTYPPKFFFHPTLSEYDAVFSGVQSFTKPFEHSIFVTLFSTALVLVLAIPAAYSLSINPVKKLSLIHI